MRPKESALSYQTFWEVGGKQAFWPTREISYRLGAVFATVAYRLGLSPNTVSICSFLVSMSALTVGVFVDGWWQVVVIAGGLQIGFGLDCADGCLARATGTGSNFGSLLDKSLDTFMMIAIPIVMWFAPSVEEEREKLIGVGLGAMIALRVTLAWFMLMKEEKLFSGDRLRLDPRQQTYLWKVKRIVGLLFDEAVYRLMIAIAFAAGYFQYFIAGYGSVLAILIVPYILSSKKELDGAEQ